jgi:hypothetical protein
MAGYSLLLDIAVPNNFPVPLLEYSQDTMMDIILKTYHEN